MRAIKKPSNKFNNTLPPKALRPLTQQPLVLWMELRRQDREPKCQRAQLLYLVLSVHEAKYFIDFV